MNQTLLRPLLVLLVSVTVLVPASAQTGDSQWESLLQHPFAPVEDVGLGARQKQEVLDRVAALQADESPGGNPNYAFAILVLAKLEYEEMVRATTELERDGFAWRFLQWTRKLRRHLDLTGAHIGEDDSRQWERALRELTALEELAGARLPTQDIPVSLAVERFLIDRFTPASVNIDGDDVNRAVIERYSEPTQRIVEAVYAAISTRKQAEVAAREAYGRNPGGGRQHFEGDTNEGFLLAKVYPERLNGNWDKVRELIGEDSDLGISEDDFLVKSDFDFREQFFGSMDQVLGTNDLAQPSPLVAKKIQELPEILLARYGLKRRLDTLNTVIDNLQPPLAVRKAEKLPDYQLARRAAVYERDLRDAGGVNADNVKQLNALSDWLGQDIKAPNWPSDNAILAPFYNALTRRKAPGAFVTFLEETGKDVMIRIVPTK